MNNNFLCILASSFLCLAVLLPMGGCKEPTLSKLIQECWKVDEKERIGANSFDLIIKSSLCEMNIYQKYTDVLNLPEKEKKQIQKISRELNDVVIRKSAKIEMASFDLVDEMGSKEIYLGAVQSTIGELRGLCSDLAFQLCYNTAKVRRIIATAGLLDSAILISDKDSHPKRIGITPCSD